jgi:hypothetical protein
MRWLLRLYPAAWRKRYGEEFAEVLAGQRASIGLVLDVIAGAIDARMYPQIRQSDLQQDNFQDIKRGDRMTFAMLQRCSVGGPKLSPSERKVASRLAIFSALGMAILYLVLTKIYRGAPAVQAVLYTSICSGFAYEQAAYLKNRPRSVRALILVGEVATVYLFMLGVCVIANRL